MWIKHSTVGRLQNHRNVPSRRKLADLLDSRSGDFGLHKTGICLLEEFGVGHDVRGIKRRVGAGMSVMAELPAL